MFYFETKKLTEQILVFIRILDRLKSYAHVKIQTSFVN
jgi:hypothetical protein